MNIYWRELRANFKGLLGWTAGILFFQLSGYSKFQGFADAQASNSINSITNSFPKALQSLFGMYGLNIGTLIGYYGILYLYFALIAAIFSGLLGANIVSKEERDKTSEFLFTKPISRNRILAEKFAAGLTYVLIIFAIIAISSILGVGITNGNNYNVSGQVIQLMWGLLLVQFLFFSLGIFFATLFTNPKISASAVTTVIVLTYFFSTLVDVSTGLAWLRFFSPLQWFSAPNIINNHHISFSYAGIAIVLSVVLNVLSFVFYNKRDLTTS